MPTAGSPLPIFERGQQYLGGTVDLMTAAPGVWVDTGLSVALPRAGRYRLTADVRTAMIGTSPINSFISTRLWNVTAGAQVANSNRLCSQLSMSAGGTVLQEQQTTPTTQEVTVSVPSTIRLEAARFNALGNTTVAAVHSNGSGFTTLLFERVG